ncbi:hypothetical protein C8Q75DRAFT_805326 [Abortiporus biennis]|nr:hypothetical protein C8Q75DRAFT_805326 [Abortiporus biennis]
MTSLTDPKVAACQAAFEIVVNKTVRHVLGGTLIEVFFMMVLYGLILLQAYVYLIYNAAKDSIFMRVFSTTLLIVETVHSVLAICIVYNYLITVAGNLAGIAKVSWTVGACFICGMVIVAMVQLVYIRRLWLLTSQLVIPFLLGATLCLRAAAYLASIILLYRSSNWTLYREEKNAKIAVNLSLALTVFGDIMICITQVHNLYHSRIGGKRTESIFSMIITYSIRSGILSVMVSAGAIIAFTLSSDTLTWTGLMLISSKLYANSMFSSLNARRSKRRILAVPFEPPVAPARIEVLQVREIEAITDGNTKFPNDTNLSLDAMKASQTLGSNINEDEMENTGADTKKVPIA